MNDYESNALAIALAGVILKSSSAPTPGTGFGARWINPRLQLLSPKAGERNNALSCTNAKSSDHFKFKRCL